MDLSKLSTEDLMALKAGDLSKVSTEGLMVLKGEPAPQKSIMRRTADELAGLVRGAGSIGATLMTPVDAAARAMGVQNSFVGRTDRREAMDAALRDLGADTESNAFAAGKIGGELAGTAGMGGALAKTAGAIPWLASKAPGLIQSLQASGMGAGNLGTKMVAGAATGGASAGLIDPESADIGAAIGGAVPLLGRAAGAAVDRIPRTLMQSAIKPTIKQLQTGASKTAIDTMLEEGISPTKGGVEKLRGLIDTKNQEIASAIQGSTATVNKFGAVRPLSDTAQRFTNQVNPTADLNTISNVGLDFLQHPAYPWMTIPVQDAQKLKQGTYKILAKKYGQIGTADTEAQKAIARGLKEEIASVVPAVKGLNEQEGRLLTTLDVAERRALIELNKNPAGLSLLTANPGAWAAFMADRSAAFKSIVARMIYTANKEAGAVLPNAGRASGLLGAQFGSEEQ